MKRFPTMPYPGEPGYETWPPDAWKILGGANSWAGMSLDVERRLVYAPTGSAAFDFYGGNRAGDNLCANSLLCLKAETGERVWHFQAVKHDVWDRDFQAPPNLITVLALAGPSMPSRRSASRARFLVPARNRRIAVSSGGTDPAFRLAQLPGS